MPAFARFFRVPRIDQIGTLKGEVVELRGGRGHDRDRGVHTVGWTAARVRGDTSAVDDRLKVSII